LDKALNGGIPEEFAVVLVSPSYDERDLLLRRVVDSALSSGSLAILISNDMGRTKDLASRYPNGFYALSTQADRISQHGPNLLRIPSFENLSDANISLGLVLKDVLAKEKATKRIMIIDILSDLLLRHKSIVTRRWLGDFVGKRKSEGFTVIATLNPLSTTKEETQSIIDYFDGVIEIFEKPLQERSRRFLVIKKMYGQRYSESEVLMDKDKLF
jgi:KaiC/GvpD/RAD55 family RecA-like ATPase